MVSILYLAYSLSLYKPLVNFFCLFSLRTPGAGSGYFVRGAMQERERERGRDEGRVKESKARREMKVNKTGNSFNLFGSRKKR